MSACADEGTGRPKRRPKSSRLGVSDFAGSLYSSVHRPSDKWYLMDSLCRPSMYFSHIDTQRGSASPGLEAVVAHATEHLRVAMTQRRGRPSVFVPELVGTSRGQRYSFDAYAGEKSILLSDFLPSYMSPTELLVLLAARPGQARAVRHMHRDQGDVVLAHTAVGIVYVGADGPDKLYSDQLDADYSWADAYWDDVHDDDCCFYFTWPLETVGDTQ
jgi:hypothetical protein